MSLIAFIFKAVETDGQTDSYEQKFLESGINSIIIPPIDFEFCNLGVLCEKLKDPGSYSGIIFTSPRAVKAVSLGLGLNNSSLIGWNTHAMFVVGESTSRCLFDLLGLQSEGKESGSAKELGEEIVKRVVNKTLLFPCGNLKTDVLPRFLRENGIAVEEITVYRTCQHSSLEGNFNSAMKKEMPDFIIFFSPSGVDYTVPLIKSSAIQLGKIKFVCIGPSTASALQKHGIDVWATAKKPNPCSLLEAIIK